MQINRNPIDGVILVIAFKFNDIFYACSTNEFKNASKRHLLILADAVDYKSYPLQERFDEIFFQKMSKNRVLLLYRLNSIIRNKLFANSYEFLILSNPFLIITKYIFARLGCKKIILVEDGAMNYYEFHENRSHSKIFVEWILFSKSMLKWIVSSYLINPDKAVIYFGVKEKLHLKLDRNVKISNILLHELSQKNILIGGGPIEFLPVNEKRALLEKTIKRFDIDVYIPHHSSQLTIEGVKNIDISKYQLTFECLMGKLNCCSIYSFGTSVALNARAFNSNIKTTLLKSDLINYSNVNISFLRLMENSCDNVLSLDDE